MTSISQTSGLKPQGQSTSSAAASQGHSPASSKSSPQTVTGEGATPTTAGSGPAETPQHGKSPSVSLNGKHMQHPAPPVAGGLTIVNGNTAPNTSLHDRKNSVTINPNLIPNGGPAGNSSLANSVRFGSLDSQGAPMNNPASLPNQPQSTLGVNASMNPRATSPQTSPSPIPQPIASGGRPPSSLQGQGHNFNFGSFGTESGDMNRPNMRPVPQGPMGPNSQSTHIRRESSHSTHGDIGNHGMPGGPPGRGGYGHGGRGRSYGQPHQPMGYSSPGPTYRSTPNQPRGGPNMGFHGHNQRSLGPFPHSPRQTARSPALSNVNPATPPISQVPMANTQMQGPHYGGYPTHMGPQQVKQQSSYPPKFSTRRYLPQKHNGPRFKPPNSHRKFTPKAQLQSPAPLTLSPESGHFEQYLTMIKTQGFVAQGYDPNYYYQPSPYSMPQTQYQYMAPPSPRAAMNVPHPPQAPYMQAQYSNQGHPPPQATPLSRSPSQVSGPDRPGSSLGPAQPSVPMTQGPSHSASRSTSSPVPKSQFIAPTKSSVVIKDPNSGKEMYFDKQTTSHPRTTPSPVKLGANTPASTPPPRTVSRAEHERSDSKTMTGEEKKQSFQDAIAQKVKAEAEARKREEAEKAERQRKEQEEAEAKARDEAAGKKAAEEAEKAAALEKEKEQEPKDAATKETNIPEAPKPSVETVPAEDEIDWDALEKELAEKEAAAEKAYAEKKRKQQEEKARKEKEEQETYIANLKKAELEAEAAEEARIRKLEQGEEDGSKKERTDLFASLKNKGAQSPTSTAESPIIRTPAESGAATPVSDISMGPPSKPATAGKRDKPAALKLETTKTVEPPQPSAAMKSLQTARFLEDPSKIAYPPAIVSPNPALNANAPVDRKFKYNKEFLLQFQSVFKEKPSIDWDSRVRETVGDSTDTPSRPGSARTPIIGSARTTSRTGIQPSFPNTGMGKFAQTPGRTQTLPPGGIGRDGFPMAAGGHGPPMANPFGHFSRGPGGLPMGSSPMSRTSSSTMQQMPSPRAGSHRGQRSGSKRDKVSRKEEETHNKAMPLTANLDIKPLVPSQTGWKPRSVGQSLSGPALGGDGHMPPDVVQRKVKANLNKMTPEKFDRISDQILDIVGQSKDESDGRTLRQVIQLTFEKATDEAHWAPMYAKFCKRMLDSMSPEIKDQNIRDKQGNVVTGGSLFRKYLLNRCQEEFERGWKINLPDKPEGVTEEAAMMSDEYYAAAAAKRRGLGLVKFIGELYKLGMLTERIMHQCVKKLVDYEGVPEEAEVESLTSLLRTIGFSLDNSEKGHGMMDAYFVRINMMMDTPGLASRLKFMLMDIIDLRRAGWMSKDGDKGPKTIVEIREAAARAQQEQEMERMRQQANRGGRMPMGRGDSRNFSGGYGNQPPPQDFASSKVGSDDLRRLKTTRNTNQPVSFGPSSMFGSRSSSGRRNLGPGGNLVRGGEDSGASSRTGTPPGGKDKKDDKEAASSVNAFSALAALNTEDSLATSPPSNPSSPPMVKSQPAVERSKTPAKEQEGRSTS
ncbi:hypothetical protein AJ78_03587 [Emergomyces pasteurianus Ep9510]|uniref:MIF4G domain-containing protein n=1 Tax=Emergomyces pasteurianus Ep9510 TaxID=1447872 RepID=A0A1J9PK37_9EURO|nr:hypothetical protein AJ78_03587 [Emergomyces pasteurianus Ep9510]